MLNAENWKKKENLIYYNPLQQEEDIKGFVLEGDAKISFPDGRMRLENARSAQEGQKANYVLWCPESFPSDVLIEWDFWPIREPGLCILFFAAQGINGEDIHSTNLKQRTGEYPQYHHGDINAFHVSYFRRKEPDERQFHTCNLRKSYGFHLVTQGGDPIPDVADAKGPYRLTLLKKDELVTFSVNGLEVFRFEDDGETYGPLLTGGKIGFRQLAPLIGEYANLSVYALSGIHDTMIEELHNQIVSLIRKENGSISLETCAQLMNYHPSYIWKLLKKKNTTFTNLVNQEKLNLAKKYLAETELSVAEISEKLNYSNPQNFIRFFSKYAAATPGEYRKMQQK